MTDGSPRRPMLYRIAKSALDRPLRLAYRVDVEGLRHIPDEGPVILAANHRSFMDSIFLALSSPRPISFLAKAEYFDHRVSRWLFRGTGGIFRCGGAAPPVRWAAVSAAEAVLAQGGVIGVYPGGDRLRDGKLHRGNLGPARLAMASGASIVPIGLIGTEEAQKRGERLPIRSGRSASGSARRGSSPRSHGGGERRAPADDHRRAHARHRLVVGSGVRRSIRIRAGSGELDEHQRAGCRA